MYFSKESLETKCKKENRNPNYIEFSKNKKKSYKNKKTIILNFQKTKTRKKSYEGKNTSNRAFNFKKKTIFDNLKSPNKSILRKKREKQKQQPGKLLLAMLKASHPYLYIYIYI